MHKCKFFTVLSERTKVTYPIDTRSPLTLTVVALRGRAVSAALVADVALVDRSRRLVRRRWDRALLEAGRT